MAISERVSGIYDNSVCFSNYQKSILFLFSILFSCIFSVLHFYFSLSRKTRKIFLKIFSRFPTFRSDFSEKAKNHASQTAIYKKNFPLLQMSSRAKKNQNKIHLSTSIGRAEIFGICRVSHPTFAFCQQKKQWPFSRSLLFLSFYWFLSEQKVLNF